MKSSYHTETRNHKNKKIGSVRFIFGMVFRFGFKMHRVSSNGGHLLLLRGEGDPKDFGVRGGHGVLQRGERDRRRMVAAIVEVMNLIMSTRSTN